MKLHATFPISTVYMHALVKLANQCAKEGVEIEKFGTLNNGFYVTFRDVTGDAVIHDFSYGHENGLFESFKMPWDHDDVSVHTPEELGMLLGALKRNEDWKHLDV